MSWMKQRKGQVQMKPNVIRVLIMGSVLGGLVHAAWAADQTGSSSQQGTAPASHTQTPAVSTSASTSTPAASTWPMAAEAVKGSITALDLAATRPSMKLSTANGTRWTLELDPKNTVVWKDGQSVRLNQLKMGQSVEVRHAVIGGNDTAQSIRIVSATPAASSTAGSQRSY